MIKNLRPFHLAIPVSDLKKAKEFYTNLLECSIGRSSDTWIDLNFYGHQLVIHLSNIKIKESHNDVDIHSILTKLIVQIYFLFLKVIYIIALLNLSFFQMELIFEQLKTYYGCDFL